MTVNRYFYDNVQDGAHDNIHDTAEDNKINKFVLTCLMPATKTIFQRTLKNHWKSLILIYKVKEPVKKLHDI
jgi:hypothetical protein